MGKGLTLLGSRALALGVGGLPLRCGLRLTRPFDRGQRRECDVRLGGGRLRRHFSTLEELDLEFLADALDQVFFVRRLRGGFLRRLLSHEAILWILGECGPVFSSSISTERWLTTPRSTSRPGGKPLPRLASRSTTRPCAARSAKAAISTSRRLLGNNGRSATVRPRGRGMAKPTSAAWLRPARYPSSANSSKGSASSRSARCSRPRPIP